MSNQGRPYDNPNKGVLFKNEEKRNDKDPDYRGNLNVAGREFWLSGWIRTPKDPNKKKFIGFTIKPKDQSAPAGGSTRSAPAPAEEEDVPF